MRAKLVPTGTWMFSARSHTQQCLPRSPVTSSAALRHAHLEAEDQHLLLHYHGLKAGRVRHQARNHVRRQVDAVILAHPTDNNDEVVDFACNPNVTVSDVFGLSTSGKEPALPVMADIPVSESLRCDLPPICLQFLVNR